MSNTLDTTSRYPMIDNYVYLYHTNTLIVVPEYADSVTDNLSVSYTQENILSRTAPIYSYQYSGPREIQVAFNLHRDLMKELNYNISNAKLEMNEDYVDVMVREIQAAALPSYSSTSKLVNPPMVAVRLGSDIFIKGVILGSVNITYKYPIIPGINSDGTKDDTKHRYSNIDISFTVAEVEPYDAQTVMQVGSYRGISTTLEKRIYNLYSLKG